MEGWKGGRVEGWKGGRVEGWKVRGLYGWKKEAQSNRMCYGSIKMDGVGRRGMRDEWDGRKVGRKEEGRIEEDGRVEGWKVRGLYGGKKEAQSRMNVAEYAFGILH